MSGLGSYPVYESSEKGIFFDVGEEEAAEQEKEMLAFRGVLLGERRGSRSVGVSSAKER